MLISRALAIGSISLVASTLIYIVYDYREKEKAKYDYVEKYKLKQAPAISHKKYVYILQNVKLFISSKLTNFWCELTKKSIWWHIVNWISAKYFLVEHIFVICHFKVAHLGTNWFLSAL